MLFDKRCSFTDDKTAEMSVFFEDECLVSPEIMVPLLTGIPVISIVVIVFDTAV